MSEFLDGLRQGDSVAVSISEKAGASYWPPARVDLVGQTKVRVDWNGNFVTFDRQTGERTDRPGQQLVSLLKAEEHNRGIFT